MCTHAVYTRPVAGGAPPLPYYLPYSVGGRRPMGSVEALGKIIKSSYIYYMSSQMHHLMVSLPSHKQRCFQFIVDAHVGKLVIVQISCFLQEPPAHHLLSCHLYTILHVRYCLGTMCMHGCWSMYTYQCAVLYVALILPGELGQCHVWSLGVQAHCRNCKSKQVTRIVTLMLQDAKKFVGR